MDGRNDLERADIQQRRGIKFIGWYDRMGYAGQGEG